jgi:hypothetical protein
MIHYRKTHNCRVSQALPSARPRALGKSLAHGMPKRCRVLALGKERHSAKIHFCRVSLGPHSAKAAHVPSTPAGRAPSVRVADGIYPLPRSNFAECLLPTLGKVSFAECRSSGTRHTDSIFFGLQMFLFST